MRTASLAAAVSCADGHSVTVTEWVMVMWSVMTWVAWIVSVTVSVVVSITVSMLVNRSKLGTVEMRVEVSVNDTVLVTISGSTCCCCWSCCWNCSCCC